jgi:hypothetical protein
MSSSSTDGLAEAERRIAEAKRAGEIVLNLSDLGLEALPESVFRLAHLRFLTSTTTDSQSRRRVSAGLRTYKSLPS